MHTVLSTANTPVDTGVAAPLAEGEVGVSLVPTEDGGKQHSQQLGHYSLQQTHTQLTFHCCEGDSQWITSDGGLSHTHCYNLCSVHGVSSKTTHTQHISRVVACGCQCGAVSWVDSDLVVKGTLLETCLPVVHLECGSRCGCSDGFPQCRRIRVV